VTLTLPPAPTCPGRQYHIKKVDTTNKDVVIDGNSTETIDGSTSLTLNTPYQSYTIVSNSANWLIL